MPFSGLDDRSGYLRHRQGYATHHRFAATMVASLRWESNPTARLAAIVLDLIQPFPLERASRDSVRLEHRVERFGVVVFAFDRIQERGYRCHWLMPLRGPVVSLPVDGVERFGSSVV